jgi:hypothetical protein
MALRRAGALGGMIQRTVQQQGQIAEGLVGDLTKQAALLDGYGY